MKVSEAIQKRRSIRRFKRKRVPVAVLKKLVNAGRLAPSGANIQPLEFVIVDKKGLVDKVFSTLAWASHIRPYGNPPQGAHPAAYIVVLNNSKKNGFCPDIDAAAAVENILLLAQEKRLGSCWLGSVDRKTLRRIIKIPKYCEIKFVVALGYPDDKPKVETLRDSVIYWKDKLGRLHVPKRSLKEVLHRNRY